MKGKKKLLTLPLAAAMVLSLTGPALAAEEAASPEESARAAFTDVADNVWYAPAVSYVTEKGIMNGTGEARFSPDMTVTRGMVYQTLYNMAGKPAVAEAATFSDVSGRWYADAAAWAEDEGLTSGTGQGVFDGERAMTRQELGKVFADYADAQGAHAANADLSTYADAASVADWARDGVERAVALGLLSGSQNRLNPTGTAQRSELAQLLMNFGSLSLESPAEAYIQAHADDFFLTGKTEYTIQGMMVSREISFHNDLENVDYTVTDDGESVVLKGTVGEQWVTKIDKVIET
ncbi:S-layer homology domain-containing protein, partial [uncultured Pseudoflavonifractor sp.]|uniref:S-layer homology domain-containing protein n=1 Tax=uncultured Pseudoflavonifractor sp. TaxID=1221379 RepID=UPI0025E6D5F7